MFWSASHPDGRGRMVALRHVRPALESPLSSPAPAMRGVTARKRALCCLFAGLTGLAFGSVTPVLGQNGVAAEPTERVAILTGQVVDSVSGTPIPRVLIRVDSGHEAFTDRQGRFEFSGLPEGSRLLAIMTADCRIAWGRVTVVERFPRDVSFRLPPAFGAKAAEDRRQVEARQRTTGRRMEAHEIEAMNARSVLELIRRLAPNMVSPTPGDVGATSRFRAARGRSTSVPDPPVLVIDGVRTPGAEGTLSQMRPNEVESIEVQPGAAAGWEYGSAGASGIIKITLKKGLASGADERPTAAPCVVPAFPGT